MSAGFDDGPSASRMLDLLEQDFMGVPAPAALFPRGTQGLGSLGEGTGLPRDIWERALLGPLRDFLSRPGKSFRAKVLRHAWALAGGEPDACPEELLLAVELLHAGSLIVDDVEDGSLERRGRPALHQIYGTAMAINTGNWLYFWPLFLLGRLDWEGRRLSLLYQEINLALLRCHQGQALDLSVRPFEISQQLLPEVVHSIARLKTGALVEMAAVLGAMGAQGDEPTRRRLGSLGLGFGVALQKLDDLGGLCRKDRRPKMDEDLKLGRATWPWAWLAQEAPPHVFRQGQELARRVVAGEETTALRLFLAEEILSPARKQVQRDLNQFRWDLRSTFGEKAAAQAWEEDLAALEQAYV